MKRFWHWLRGRHGWSNADYDIDEDYRLLYFEARCDCGGVVAWEAKKRPAKAVST